MPKTLVGLFKNSDQVNAVVREIEALGVPRKEVQTLTEPASFEVSGVMSFPRLDFEVEVGRELARIGATKSETEVYLQGLRDGGALVFATGGDEQIDGAARVMNQHGAVEVDETSGSAPRFPGVVRPGLGEGETGEVQAGRIREHGGGAALFVW